MSKNVNETMNADLAYDNKIYTLGRVTSIIALLAMISVPAVVTIIYDIDINVPALLPAFGSVVAMMLPTSIVECISYYPIFGAGASYISFITGNVMNMKLPCAISGMKIAKVEPGTREGDIIATISTGVSSIVTTIILFLGMLVIGQVLAPLLNNVVLKPGFDNIMPALTGALAIPFVLKSPKISAAPIITALVLCFVLGPTVVQGKQSYLMPLVMIVSVLVAYILYKGKKL